MMGIDSIRAGSMGPAATPEVRRIGLADIGDALHEGMDDFMASPTHLIFLGLIYPVAGLLLGRIASGSNALHLVYPLVTGFALIGPAAAIGMYELSRQREEGHPVRALNAFDVLRRPQIGAILLLAAMLAVLFVLWLMAAQAIYEITFGGYVPASISDLVTAVFTTPAGWRLMVIGTAVGFLFAVVALTLGVVSFPLLVDRDFSAMTPEQAAIALGTSWRAVVTNPGPMAAWGLVVVAGLAFGAVTLLVGLAVVMPVLGHATWHLYRKVGA
jgi:uncharacterized membrane protein